MGIRTAGAGASAPMMLRTVCAARRDCASGVSERADGSETSTASAEESSFLTAVVSGGRRPDMTGTITSFVSRMVGLLFAARGMRPFLSRGMERLPPRKRVSPGMILTSLGFRSRAFRAATRGRVGMISPPQRMKSGGETLFSGAGENSSLFSTTVPREGADVVICGGSPTNLSARGNWSVFPTMLEAGIIKSFQSGGRGERRADSLICRPRALWRKRSSSYPTAALTMLSGFSSQVMGDIT